MKHIIAGGDGFLGRHLAAMLSERGEEVIVADIARSDLPVYRSATHLTVDVRDTDAVERLPIASDDVVYNLAARMLTPIQPRAERREFCWPVNFDGARNLMAATRSAGGHQFVQFTTDMVYGRTQTVPKTEDHPLVPIGEYGASKKATEDAVDSFRSDGLNVTILRPRLIIGPGRLGILAKLFKLIDRNLPVPMIGRGKNPYQFVSVFDCAEAAILAWRAGTPNRAYNLGSDDPPPVRELLGNLIRSVHSRSILVSTPGSLVKLVLGSLDRLNKPLLDPEQYMIADEYCLLDNSRAKRELGWQPRFTDADMLVAAYEEYRRGSVSGPSEQPIAIPAE